MGQLVVRNLEDATKEQLRRRADRHGRSMEEEIREILRDAVREEDTAQGPGLGTQIAALFKGKGLKKPIRELRGYVLKPPSFKK
jgi:plasmid stability protein